MSALTDATVSERHQVLSARFLSIAEGATDWDAPTPVKEWTARDIVTHLSWLPEMLKGMGVDLLVPGYEDPIEQLRSQTAAVQEMLDAHDAGREIDTQMSGVQPLEQVIDNFYNFDLFAHAWDLAKASGQEVEFDDDYAAGAHQGMSAMGPALQASGQFGEPQPVAEDATPMEKLMAFLGRNPTWAP